MFLRMVAAAILGCAVVSGCASPEPEARPEILYIGLQTDQPGLGFFDGQRRSGFEFDLANWIANHLKATPYYIDVKPDQRERVITERGVALMIGTYSQTDKRDEVVAFAGPYLTTRQGVMVRASDTTVNALSDLTGRGTVCAARGTTSIVQLRERGINLVEMTGDGECVSALQRPSDVLAVSTDQLILRGWANRDKRVRVIDGTFGNQERYGVGMARGDRALCEKVTAALKEYLLSGTWDVHFRNHFGTVPVTDHKPDVNGLNRCA